MAVYDCCIINDEIDLLKIRMDLLSKYVDYFVIVEINKTFRGENKEYKLLPRLNEFEIYKDKLIYVNSDNIPEWKGPGDWSIEAHQRNCIAKGLIACREEDIIMISDVDEIPNPQILTNPDDFIVHAKWDSNHRSNKKSILKMVSLFGVKESIRFVRNKMTLSTALEKTPVLIRMKNHYYYINCRSEGGVPGTVICKFSNMLFPQVARLARYNMPYLYDEGWHFSYLGGVSSIKNKLNSILDDRPDIIEKMKKFSSQDDYIYACLNTGKDLFGRDDKANSFKFIDKDDVGLPQIEKYIDLFPYFFHL